MEAGRAVWRPFAGIQGRPGSGSGREGEKWSDSGYFCKYSQRDLLVRLGVWQEREEGEMTLRFLSCALGSMVGMWVWSVGARSRL